MAINKRQSSLWVKATIIFVVLAFVITAVPVFFMGDGQPQAPEATGTGAALERIAQNYAPTVTQYQTMLQSEPTSYTVLVATGDAYFDWAFQIRNEVGQAGIGFDLPMWNAAASFYERALDVEPGDPGVATGLAISYFYSEQRELAIETIEAVIEESPEFAPAYFEAGIFYRADGRLDDALVAFETHITLAPETDTAATARTWADDLRAQGASAEETLTP